MVWYRITYKKANGRPVSGIKQYHIKNIDDAFDYFQAKAKASEPELQEFDCVMISEKSEVFKAWVTAREKRRRYDNYGQSSNSGPGKYRKKGEGPELGQR
jgi:hypothetical protein